MVFSIRNAAIGSVLLAVGAFALLTPWRARPPATGDALPAVSIGGPFTLTDQTGRAVTEASFGGRWLLVYFGYTSCPDICPTQLQVMAEALHRVGASADRVAPLFVTVDPAHDTVAVLANYTRLFDSRIVGLTGTSAQIAAVEARYKVYAARVASPAGGYAMDHSAFVYLMDPAGQLRALFDRTTPAAAMAETIARALR